MIGRVVHLMRKDLGEHRAWFAAFVGLVALRAALVGSGIDAGISDRNLLVSLSLASFLLTVLDGALLVALAVQLVQGDRLVGTMAFWLTRPVRGSTSSWRKSARRSLRWCSCRFSSTPWQ